MAETMIRDDIKTALVTAMKAGERERTGAIRLIQAAIKNRDIEARTGKSPDDDDALVVEVLNKMAKQRRESIDMYQKGNRPELAKAEAEELAAIDAIVAETGAAGPRDMGKVIAALKAKHGTSLDMSKASGLVKARLAG